MARVAALWRHPIKSHGREALQSVALAAGQPFPWDRRWAVVHDAAVDDASTGWIPCQNFMIGTRTPGLAGIWARFDEAKGEIALRHADLGEISFSPDDAEDQARFLDWVMPLCPETRAQSIPARRASASGALQRRCGIVFTQNVTRPTYLVCHPHISAAWLAEVFLVYVQDSQGYWCRAFAAAD